MGLRNSCAVDANLRDSSEQTVDFERANCESLADAYDAVSPHSYRDLMSFEVVHALVMI